MSEEPLCILSTGHLNVPFRAQAMALLLGKTAVALLLRGNCWVGPAAKAAERIAWICKAVSAWVVQQENYSRLRRMPLELETAVLPCKTAAQFEAQVARYIWQLLRLSRTAQELPLPKEA